MGAQRDRHFQYPKKALGQFLTPPRLAAWMVETALLWLPRPASMLDVSLIEGDALRLVRDLEGRFDLVAANPPFSAKYGRVRDPWLLGQFALAAGRRSEAIEALFLELSVRALREGGVLAIVLPDGLLSGLPNRRVREWLLRQVRPLAIVGLSRRLFPAKTCVLFARKGGPPEPVRLAHSEDEEDLDRIAEEIRRGGGLLLLPEALGSSWSPSHHLTPPPPPAPFPTLPLGDLLIEMRGGRAPKRSLSGSGVPLLSAKVVVPWGVDLRRDGRRIPPGGMTGRSGPQARKGDVLFVRVGVGCIGRAAVVLEEDEEGIADDCLYILRFRKDRMLPEFFSLLAQTGFFRLALRRIQRGTGTVTVPQSLLRTLPVPVPPLSVQASFAKAYRRLHRRAREGGTPLEEVQRIVARLEALLSGDRKETAARQQEGACPPGPLT